MFPILQYLEKLTDSISQVCQLIQTRARRGTKDGTGNHHMQANLSTTVSTSRAKGLQIESEQDLW